MMYTINELLGMVTDELSAFVSEQREPEELYQPINYTLNAGGKRVRPVLALMASNLFTDDVSETVKPAVGLEIFHNFTLLHDDIMDNSSVRRNRPTVHVKWNENVAILAGDTMSIIASDFIAEAPSKVLKQALKLFNRTAMEVCEGQQYDMNFEDRDIIGENGVKLEEYIEMIRLKTSVLIACCLKTGALIGGASQKDAKLLYDFGLNIGLAFQLQDDYLDVFGDFEKFGKATGGDIVANKKTYLLIKAFELADTETLEKLKSWTEKKDFDRDEKVDAVKKIYQKLGVEKKSKAKMQEYFEKGMEALKNVSVPNEKKEELQKLAEQLMNRKN